MDAQGAGVGAMRLVLPQPKCPGSKTSLLSLVVS